MAEAKRRPWVFSIRGMMGLVLGTAILSWLTVGFLRGVRSQQRAAWRGQCIYNLKMIGLALHNYHEANGCFPPAYTTDSQGRPLHSWRTLLIPYLESTTWYSQIDLAEPWDGPHNRQFHSLKPSVFFCPNHPDHAQLGQTSYVAIVGPRTLFPGGGKSTTKGDVRDGLEDTIAIVESASSAIHWMEPRDLEIDRMSFQYNDHAHPGVSSWGPGGPQLLMAYGGVRSMYRPIPEAIFRGMLTIAGGDVVRDY